MMDLDLEQRVFDERVSEKFADAHEFRIRHGADARAADDLALGWRGHGCAAIAPPPRPCAPRQQPAARGCEDHAARNALEQRNPELVLERLDLRAHRRLADVQSFSCAGQMTQLGDGSETS
jgi:hypothetical protein